MADNYLEKRYEQLQSAPRKAVHRPSLDTLLLKNRSYRAYDSQYKVHQIQLDAMIAVNTRIASGMNAQRLRFRCVTDEAESAKVLGLIRMGAALKELSLPLPGTEPQAFIVVCSSVGENQTVLIDLGISLQSMLLKAVEMGLGGLIVRNFDHKALQQALDLPLEPIAVLAVGKPAEKVELVEVHRGDSLDYYRRDGVHFVPKIAPSELKIG